MELDERRISKVGVGLSGKQKSDDQSDNGNNTES